MFRECRLITINEVFKEIKSDVSIEKTFLAIGGIKAGVYIIEIKGLKFIVPTGCGEVNNLELCEMFEMEYEKVDVELFTEKFLEDTDYRNDNIFILPCSGSIFNKRDIGDLSKLMIGQSSLMISHIDVEECKVYLLSNQEEKSYWVDLNIFKSLRDKKSWPMGETVKVFKINKLDIRQSKKLDQILKKRSLELLINVVQDYKCNTRLEFPDGVIRLDGLETYLFTINHLKKFLVKLQSEESENNGLQRYVYLQLKYYHMFIVSGSNGYYRDEFAKSIDYVLKDISLDEKFQIRDEWRNISRKWRGLGRCLGQYLKEGHQLINCIEYLITQLDEISKKEIIAMSNLEKVLTKNSEKYNMD